MAPTKKAGSLPVSLPLLVVAGVVVLVGAAGAGGHFLKKEKPQGK